MDNLYLSKWQMTLTNMLNKTNKQSYSLSRICLLCPWDSPGKNTGMGSHSLLQGIFPTQGSNPGLLHYRRSVNHLSYQGNPSKSKPDPKEYIENMMPSPNAKHWKIKTKTKQIFKKIQVKVIHIVRIMINLESGAHKKA